MDIMPNSETYEESLEYMPYRDSLRKVLEYLVLKIPKDGSLIDLMCGPGYLLGNIAKNRPDLQLCGIDIKGDYIEYAKDKYPNIKFEEADVLDSQTGEYSAVTMTGCLHHLTRMDKLKALANAYSITKRNGFCLISDCFIDDYSFMNKTQRQLAAAKLGYEYLIETIQNDASDYVLNSTIDILRNDVIGYEYKTSTKKLQQVIEYIFPTVDVTKVWPKSYTEYGDYIYICRKL